MSALALLAYTMLSAAAEPLAGEGPIPEVGWCREDDIRGSHVAPWRPAALLAPAARLFQCFVQLA